MTPLIVALDFDNDKAALDLADRLDPQVCRVKVGKELFTRVGPPVVKALHARGFQVFLDLKFHDIPQTVAKASRAAADLGVWMFNVHSSGGPAMLAAAREAVGLGPGVPLLIGVTVLTSLDAATLQLLGYQDGPEALVQRLAGMVQEAGLDGVVCSAQEAFALRQRFPDLLRVTPGIRPAAAAADDQRRVMTAAAALAAGASYLVVGRPITAATDPLQALRALVAELDTGVASTHPTADQPTAED